MLPVQCSAELSLHCCEPDHLVWAAANRQMPAADPMALLCRNTVIRSLRLVLRAKGSPRQVTRVLPDDDRAE